MICKKIMEEAAEAAREALPKVFESLLQGLFRMHSTE